ncbi:MAG: nucleoside kinase [Muribaculaceae bacterium]|nr:nucleoside kinase [Muribaculaceae bacterium]
MKPTIKIYCRNISSYIDVEGGETLIEVASRLFGDSDFTPVCAIVNNRSEDLGFPIFMPKQVEYLDATSAVGRRTVVRSLCMLLYRAVCDILPDSNLRIEHSISHGYYCRLVDPDTQEAQNIDPETIEQLRVRMQQLVEADLPFERKERLTEDVLKRFRRQRLTAKVLLLETTRRLYTTYYTLDGIADSFYGPLVPNTGLLKVFDLLPWKDGMLLLPPDSTNPKVPATPVVQEKMYRAFTEHLRFNRIIRVSNVGELNRAVRTHQTSQLINVAEAMHDKLLGKISDQILERRRQGGGRIVLIAGPSSSGKTTTTKRLGIQLMTNLMTPKMISLDDYFIDRHLTPRDASGDYDYEHLHALDLERLNSDLRSLLDGEEINLPTYSFEFGRRIDKDRPLRLEPDEVLLIEGIHGLNPELVSGLDQGDVFKVYVSALTTLRIDNHNWISTTDNRLLRRVVRDHRYRHISALETLRRWPSVRRGEERWIFPFQENADATFNSSLIFELGVMKAYAEPLLHDVPQNDPQYAEAFRLLKLLGYFENIPVDQIPTTSLLREFLGGSSFHY